jgi:hypothetical protein
MAADAAHAVMPHAACWDDGRGLILRQRAAADRADRAQALRTVTTHPGQHDADTRRAEGARNGAEQYVGRRPHAPHGCGIRQ